jgi:hypothetical protein
VAESNSPEMSLLGRLPLFAACLVAGFAIERTGLIPSSDNRIPTAANVTQRGDETLVPAPSAESALIAEWEQLRGPVGAVEAFPGVHLKVQQIADSVKQTAFSSGLIADWAATDP